MLSESESGRESEFRCTVYSVHAYIRKHTQQNDKNFQMEINLNKLDLFAAAKRKMKIPVDATFSAHTTQIIVKPICREMNGTEEKIASTESIPYRCQREREI